MAVRIIDFIKVRLLKYPALYCIFSGIIFSLSFLNEYLFLFAYIGLILFFISLYEKATFKKTFCFFFGALPIVYSWFAELYPFAEFGFSPFQGVLVVILGIFGITAIHSSVISLIFLLIKLVPNEKEIIKPLFTAAIFVIYEWLLNIGPLKFSWATIPITQIKFSPLLQTASLFGASFITFTVVTVCGYFALFIVNRKTSFLKIGVTSLLLPVIVGSVLLVVPTEKASPVYSAAIQGNALSNEKWDSDKLNSYIDTYIDLTRDAAENGAKLIVLPESAFPTYFYKNGSIHKRLSDIAKKYGVFILSGVLIPEENGVHNAMIGIRPDGTLTNYYSKRNLVPFGETIPFEKLSYAVMDLFGIELSRIPYISGSDANIIQNGDFKYGGIVCYDSIFSGTVRDSVKSGANMLVVVTNDSWYNDAPAVKQHVWYAVLRAVENGRYVVRAANTGISCFITPKGQVVAPTKPLVEAITYQTVYATQTNTLYTKIGDVFLYISFIMYLILIIVTLLKTKQKTPENNN